jgi:hypothetical protein
MPVNIVGQNSIVIAHQVNPSIFNPNWLIGQNIIQKGQIRENGIVTPQLVHLRTDEFELLVLPERIQLTPFGDMDKHAGVVLRVIGGIVTILEHTPYTAAGMNFIYSVDYPAEDYASRTRELLVKDNPLSLAFASKDARFGAYYSMDHAGLDCRLRLDVKPVRRPGGEELLNLSFNLQKEVPKESPIQPILDFLGKWDDARQVVDQIAHSIG